VHDLRDPVQGFRAKETGSGKMGKDGYKTKGGGGKTDGGSRNLYTRRKRIGGSSVTLLFTLSSNETDQSQRMNGTCGLANNEKKVKDGR